MTITYGRSGGDTTPETVLLPCSSATEMQARDPKEFDDNDMVPDSEGQSAQEDQDNEDSESEVTNELRLCLGKGHRDHTRSSSPQAFNIIENSSHFCPGNNINLNLKERFAKEMGRRKHPTAELKLWLKKHENEICAECKEINQRCAPNPNGISCLACQTRNRKRWRVILERKERITKVLGINEKQYEELMKQWQNGKTYLKDERNNQGGYTGAKKRKREEGKVFDTDRENNEESGPKKTKLKLILREEHTENEKLWSTTLIRAGNVPGDSSSSSRAVAESRPTSESSITFPADLGVDPTGSSEPINSFDHKPKERVSGTQSIAV
ncbi:hypothetical protein VKT23_012026 [Stygiomarasmius scandens]|uniref:Uncharacterized protein n=1 Tax=Marasmiellus scandens TaxID=2682957 RepID=A0ABR1JC67_9AGAR